MIAGCSSQDDPDPTQTDEPDDDGNDGNDGNDGGGNQDSIPTLVHAEQGTPPTVDPHEFDPSDTSALFALPENGYETLVTFPPDSAEELIPALAAEVPGEDQIGDDLQSIEFTLRQGVTFHTGGEMTAEDVKYSWDRAMELDLSPDAGLLGPVAATEAVDDYTFRVELSEPIAPVFLLSTVTRPITSVVSQEAVESNGGVSAGQPNEYVARNSVGTGPFKTGNFQSGNELVWEPHEDYWGETKTERVRQVAAPEFSTRRAMLERGDAHVIHGSADYYQELEGAQNVETSFFPSFDPTHMNLNFEIPYGRDDLEDITGGDDTVPSEFFQDPDVRKGFAYAFRYDDYIETVWSGFMARMNCYHFPGMLGYDDSAPIYEHDPEKAEEHFRAAGYWEEGFRLTTLNENLAQFTEGNLLLKDSIEALNDRFEINAVELPEGPATEHYLADPAGYPLAFHGFLPQGADPDAYYRALMHEDGSVSSVCKAHKYIDEQIPQLIDEAREAQTVEQRSEIYTELQQLCFDEVSTIPVGVEEYMVSHQPCVEVARNPGWTGHHFKHFDISSC